MFFGKATMVKIWELVGSDILSKLNPIMKNKHRDIEKKRELELQHFCKFCEIFIDAFYAEYLWYLCKREVVYN